MKCPMCGDGFENVALKTVNNSTAWAKHCNQCGGFWFEREPEDFLSLGSINNVDIPTPNYSLKNIDLVCPNDNSLLTGVEAEDLPTGSQYWRCPDCGGAFYPRGQLALIAHWQHELNSEHIAGVMSARSRTTIAFLLVAIGVVAGNAAIQRADLGLSATTTQVLPTSGPNILTLALLGLTYLAGTVLAVLGRRVSLVLVGWSVILICLVGFSVIIFGP